MDNKELLEERIGLEFDNLDDLEGEEKSKAIEDLVKLYKLRIEEEKVEIEADEKYNRRVMEDDYHTRELALRRDEIDNEKAHNEAELEMQKNQLKYSIGDKIADVAMGVGTFLIGLRWSTKRYWEGLRFEQEGTITSHMVKGISSKIFPKK